MQINYSFISLFLNNPIGALSSQLPRRDTGSRQRKLGNHFTSIGPSFLPRHSAVGAD
ncbi:hypothetical protein NTG1052_540015 [Candidatus Nitrotoga sp. 1052]|nr:hypothetical protein NTG1052_540015 [Candidatus Nitrotoga sp. 1052]